MEYKIVQSDGVRSNRKNLEEEVNNLLGDGWFLHGGLVVTSDTFGTQLYQAMTKPSEGGDKC